MCGIAGYFLSEQKESAWTIFTISFAIRHRGPDDEEFCLVNTGTNKCEIFVSQISPPEIIAQMPQLAGNSLVGAHDVALAHVRYSIIDLSPNGHQPMWSHCGNACITFNGEIYNYVELRDELEQLGHVFHTKSDTEVFLAGFMAWGEGILREQTGSLRRQSMMQEEGLCCWLAIVWVRRIYTSIVRPQAAYIGPLK
jgi:asparagine synthase (glutamine-hydrolysing)